MLSSVISDCSAEKDGPPPYELATNSQLYPRPNEFVIIVPPSYATTVQYARADHAVGPPVDELNPELQQGQRTPVFETQLRRMRKLDKKKSITILAGTLFFLAIIVMIAVFGT